jgi:hypothetical protein
VARMATAPVMRAQPDPLTVAFTADGRVRIKADVVVSAERGKALLRLLTDAEHGVFEGC